MALGGLSIEVTHPDTSSPRARGSFSFDLVPGMGRSFEQEERRKIEKVGPERQRSVVGCSIIFTLGCPCPLHERSVVRSEDGAWCALQLFHEARRLSQAEFFVQAHEADRVERTSLLQRRSDAVHHDV
mgnify:CR=1 FL=1